MNKINFSEAIIIYELFNREYDNALLLKTFLENRGLKVTILYKLDIMELKYTEEPKLVFIPNCYNSENFDWYYHLLNGKNFYFVDLQYEQALSNNKNNIDFHIPKGTAAQIIHLCWGEQYRNMLLDHGIKPDKAFTSGALHLDFLRPKFLPFWETRKKLSEQFGIAEDKHWNLYISSFSVADNEISKIGVAADLGDEYAEYFADFSSRSRKKTVEWFSELLKINDDNIYIYRKHPAELLCLELEKLQSQYPDKFYIIDSYNIKQWIVLSDRILTWYSTSIAECYVAKKSFYILRPVKIDYQYEVQMYERGHFIETIEDLKKALSMLGREIYPIDTNLINSAYRLDGDLAVVSIGTLLDQEFKYDYFESKNEFKKKRKTMLRKEYIMLKHTIKKMYKWCYNRRFICIKSKKMRSKFAISEWERSLPISEIDIKEKKLKEILSNCI